MRFPAPLLALAVFSLLAGCARTDPEPAPSKSETTTAPSSAPATTPPATTVTETTGSQPAPDPDGTTTTTKPRPVANDKELEDYSRKLWVVMGARDLAERQWKDALKKQATEIDKKGLTALLPPFQSFSKAMDRAVKGAQAIQPPASAKAFHAEVLNTLDRLNENLQTSVDAIQSGDGELAAQLSAERRVITEEGGDAAKKALEAGGFDVKQYLSEHRLVRKG